MKRWVIVLTDEGYDDLLKVVGGASRARIRPAVKVWKLLEQHTERFEGDVDRLVKDLRSGRYRSIEESVEEPAPEDAPQEPQAPQHGGMRPKRGRRQS